MCLVFIPEPDPLFVIYLLSGLYVCVCLYETEEGVGNEGLNVCLNDRSLVCFHIGTIIPEI